MLFRSTIEDDEVFKEAKRVLRELSAIRQLEEEGYEEEEARLELYRRAILGGRAVAVLRDLRLTQTEISALFLARMTERQVEEAARIAVVTRREAEAAYRAFELLGRDPWDVLWALEAFTVPLPWEEEASYGRVAEVVERAIARLCARAGSLSLLRRTSPSWLVFGERWVYVTEEVFGEFGYGSGDVWVLAERMGWRKALRGKHKRDKAAGLEILEFEARYFGREPPVRRELRHRSRWRVWRSGCLGTGSVRTGSTGIGLRGSSRAPSRTSRQRRKERVEFGHGWQENEKEKFSRRR